MKLKKLWDYSQPEFYHFSQDSILLSKYFTNHFTVGDSDLILDAFCGCGVVGLEVAMILDQDLIYPRFSFCEIQKEYEQHLNENIVHVFNETKTTNIFIEDFNTLSTPIRFDYILANPPYFEQGSGKLSENKKKNLCRHFINTSVKSMQQKACDLLKDKGTFVFLVRDQIVLEECRGFKNLVKIAKLNDLLWVVTLKKI